MVFHHICEFLSHSRGGDDTKARFMRVILEFCYDSSMSIGCSQSCSWPSGPSHNIYIEVIDLATLGLNLLNPPCTQPLLCKSFTFSEPQTRFFLWWWKNDHIYSTRSSQRVRINSMRPASTVTVKGKAERSFYLLELLLVLLLISLLLVILELFNQNWEKPRLSLCTAEKNLCGVCVLTWIPLTDASAWE